MDLDYVQRVSIGAAHKGANILRHNFGNLKKVSKKGEIDLVTEADTASEKAIIEEIQSRFPEHSILAEESGVVAGSHEYQWVIDPLDGTTNFANCLGLYAVSIAFVMNGTPVIGTVLNPESGELFTACSGQGASLNGAPIRVSGKEEISDSLLVTGFPYDFKIILKPLMQRFESCLQAARGIRRLGSAALDLCYVACGRFEGFWEQNLKPWDTAAGIVIAQESGARVTDFAGNLFEFHDKEILATNGKIHNRMISLLELNGIK